MKNRAVLIELSRVRRFRNYIMKGLIWLVTLTALVPLFVVFFHVIKHGLPAINLDFFTNLPTPVGQTGGGMANALVGSILMVLLASMIGIPLGVMGGVYLSEYGRGRLPKLLRFLVDLLTSIPSIVVGLFIYAILVVPFKGFSAYAGAATLAFLMFPSIIKTTEEVLKLIPHSVREAGLALGIPRWRVIMQIVLKGSLSSVSTGVILAIARVAGETAPLLFTAFGNRFWPQSLSEPTPSLPVQIFSYAISPFDDWHRQAWAGALLLVFMVFVFNISARLLLLRSRVRSGT